MALDDRTRPYELGGPVEPTARLEVPEQPTDPYPEAPRRGRDARGEGSRDAGEYAYDRTRAAREPSWAASAPIPAPAAFPAAAPIPAAAYGVPAWPGRGPGPGGLARAASLLLCLLLTGAALALLAAGIVGTVLEAQIALTGQEGSGAPVSGPLLLLGAVVAAFLAVLTTAWSGLGAVICGAIMALLGGATMFFPQLLAGLLAGALDAGAFSTGIGPLDDVIGGAVDDVVAGVAAAVSSLLAVTTLLLGAVYLAAGLGARAARRAGWSRGAGR
ncbi:hypothetical protein USB125703_01292 [Pseudoclavibacter triregionum]|nr:hypothetical protein USB125703_01292 [Pseudoclavibacter triregionum]